MYQWIATAFLLNLHSGGDPTKMDHELTRILVRAPLQHRDIVKLHTKLPISPPPTPHTSTSTPHNGGAYHFLNQASPPCRTS